MTIWATLSEALITIEPDTRATRRVFLRPHARAPFKPLAESDIYKSHVERCSKLSDQDLITELRSLRREQQITDPTHWMLWRLSFMDMPEFLFNFHLRAGEMGRGRDAHGKALERARKALAFGARGSGRPRKEKEKIPA
jgi:hypothetical protein